MGLILIRKILIYIALFSAAGWVGLPLSARAADSGHSFTLVVTGDMMLGNWAQGVILQKGMAYPFQAVDSVLRDAEVVFANLEAPFGEGGAPFEKSFTFRVNPKLVKVLRHGGINLVSLANNHMMDYGAEVMEQTRRLLKAEGIWFAGAGLNQQEAMQPAIFTVNGVKVAFVACSLTFPEEFWASDTSAGTYFPYQEVFYRQIRQLKQENDLVLVSFHWGEELRKTPKQYQRQLAHQTVEAGADLIVGHHPHIIQGLEVYRGKLIAYSLGNFVFGSYSSRATRSMMLKLRMGTSGIEWCKIYPLNVDNREVEFQPKLLQGREREAFLQELKELSKELNGEQDVISSGNLVTL